MDKPHVNHATDRICMLCKKRMDIFHFQMSTCSIGCGFTFHSVCHSCVNQLVKEKLSSLPIEQHLNYNYLPEGG